MVGTQTRKLANFCLSEVIIAARESRGLDISKAAELAGLTEPEFVVIETYPMLVSLATLSKIMTTFGKLQELTKALNKITVLAMRENETNRPEYEVETPKFSSSLLEMPPPEH